MNAENAILGEVPRWAVMWLLAGGLFFAGKAAVLRSAGLRGWRFAGFALGWAGMDAEPFRAHKECSLGLQSESPESLELIGLKSETTLALALALMNLVLGGLLLWGVARCFPHPLAAGWVGMVGLIFVLHFGIFALLAVVWNACGVRVTPIMRRPVAAVSLAEFWGRRWNIAFRDLAHRFVFVPVAQRRGHKTALWASFAVSGLAHELVISVPAGAGFGLPLGYFMLQALGISLERRLRTTSWLRTHAFTALPAFLLFHPPFVERVMVPFFRVIEALP
jgi:hypothetical protein